MGKKQLTKEEREDIITVIEATQRLLPLYEHLRATDVLTEEEQALLEQIQQTFQDVLEYSGQMIHQIQVLQFENAVDAVCGYQAKERGPMLSDNPGEDLHQTFTEYLRALVNEQAN